MSAQVFSRRSAIIPVLTMVLLCPLLDEDQLDLIEDMWPNAEVDIHAAVVASQLGTEDFFVGIKGAEWLVNLHGRHGRTYSAFVVKPSDPSTKAWLARYHFSQSVHFGIGPYGLNGAALMAYALAKKWQLYYDV